MTKALIAGGVTAYAAVAFLVWAWCSAAARGDRKIQQAIEEEGGRR